MERPRLFSLKLYLAAALALCFGATAVAKPSCDSLFKASWPAWGAPKPAFGDHDVVVGRSGVVRSVALDRGSWLQTRELFVWGETTNRPAFVAWNFWDAMPLRSVYAALIELPRIKNYDFNDPFLFRRLVKPYLKKLVTQGRNIHVNLDSRDEAFLRSMAEFSAAERKVHTERWIKDFFSRSDSGDGALTRYELLIVTTDKEIFEATHFYRNYKDPIDPAEAASLRLY